MGASRAARAIVETYTEPQFVLDGKKVRPDGVVRISFGKARWTALVEIKTGNGRLEADQINAYWEIARQQNFDAVVTILNEIAASPGSHPTEGLRVRANSKIQVHHISWTALLSTALMFKVHRGVDDPEQAWLVGELIRYVEHSASGAMAFDEHGRRHRDLNGHQGSPDHGVCERARSGGSWGEGSMLVDRRTVEGCSGRSRHRVVCQERSHAGLGDGRCCSGGSRRVAATPWTPKAPKISAPPSMAASVDDDHEDREPMDNPPPVADEVRPIPLPPAVSDGRPWSRQPIVCWDGSRAFGRGRHFPQGSPGCHVVLDVGTAPRTPARIHPTAEAVSRPRASRRGAPRCVRRAGPPSRRGTARHQR